MDTLLHFLVSASLGFTAFSLTWIISLLSFGQAVHLPGTTSMQSGDKPTLLLSFSVGLFFSLLSHMWLDGLLPTGSQLQSLSMIAAIFYGWYILGDTIREIAFVVCVASLILIPGVSIFLIGFVHEELKERRKNK